LLALTYRLLGVGDAAPLIWNLLFASLVIVAVNACLRGRLAGRWCFATLVAVILLTPLPVIVLCGMEHTMHIALSLAFAVSAAHELTADRAGVRTGSGLPLLALAALLPTARYEGLFAVWLVTTLFAVRGRPGRAAALLMASIVPLGLYGMFSVAHGWFLLPTSVLLKGGVHDLGQVLLRGPKNLLKAQALTLLIAAGLVALVLDRKRAGGRWSENHVLLGLFLAMSWFQVQFAAVGWLHRYEAYLKVVGIVAIVRVLPGMLGSGAPSPVDVAGRRRLALSRLALAALVLVLASRGIKMLMEGP